MTDECPTGQSRIVNEPQTTIRPTVLILDDDWELTAMLVDFLGREGYDVRTADRPSVALDSLKAAQPAALILDVMLPEKSGLEVLRELRARGTTVPILMLTALGDEVDRVVGLEFGADDYLGKPFSPRELLARLRSILRRATPPAGATTILNSGALTLDLQRRRVSLGGASVAVTGAEFGVLRCLLEHQGKVVERGRLTEEALGRAITAFDRSIDTHVSNLRRKFAAFKTGDIPEIRNVRGAGYILTSGEDGS